MRSLRTRALCSKSSWVNSTHQRKSSRTAAKSADKSPMPPIFSKRIPRSSIKLWARKELEVSRESSVAWESEMDNYLLLSSLSLKINKNVRLSKTKLVSCKWARASPLCSATRRLTSRIVSGFSWNWWTAVRSLPCSKSSRASTQRNSASTVFTRPSKA